MRCDPPQNSESKHLTPSKFLGSMLTLRLLTSKEDESSGGGGALCTGVLERSRLEHVDDAFGEEQ